MKTVAVVGFLGCTVLCGCTSMSGLDAKSSFACKAPDGVLCESMSGIYANAQARNLPGQRVGGQHTGTAMNTAMDPARGGVTPASGTGILSAPISSGTPIRSTPVVLRIWFAPWEDSDGDLHDQSYVYLPVDHGRWLIAHNRRRIQDAYRPVHAPTTGAANVTVAPPIAGAQGGMRSLPQEAADSDGVAARSPLDTQSRPGAIGTIASMPSMPGSMSGLSAGGAAGE